MFGVARSPRRVQSNIKLIAVTDVFDGGPIRLTEVASE